MDGGNGTVSPKPKNWKNTTVTVYLRLPGELKYLIHSYQDACRMQSFNEAARRLLETHPELAKHAAMLYNGSNEHLQGENTLWVLHCG
jgi:hypothetical protein